jgi:hypothetical protein
MFIDQAHAQIALRSVINKTENKLIAGEVRWAAVFSGVFRNTPAIVWRITE